ncbi:hypothetical protein FZC66_05960 [Priestia megaterium]|nr:hypothetical protein FZC66_05960 [Priestia megaterium]
MRGRPEWKIEHEKIYKTKKNNNGMLVARIIQKPIEDDLLEFSLMVQNRKTKAVLYHQPLVVTGNDYYSFRLARGDIKWVSLYTVAVWDGLGAKLVEVAALTGKENERISNAHCSAYRERDV